MKKLLIATIEFPPQKGGVANYLASLAGHLPQEKVIVLAPDNHPQTISLEKRDGYKIYRKKIISKFPLLWPKWLPLLFYLFRIVRQEKIEAILVGQVLPVGTAALAVKRILGIPFFVSCHGMDILVPQSVPRKNRILLKILAEARGIITNSHFTKRELVNLGVAEEKVVVVYPCPGEKKEASPSVREEVRRKYNLQDKKILLTVGRLVERKGHDKVVEALPKILEYVPNVVYIVVGDGPEKEKLQVLSSKLQVQDKVMFAGEVSKEKLRAFYELCDIFIMVPRQIGSDVEGFGTVYLEANQYGKPAIAGRSGGVAEAVEDGVTGLLVDPTDVDQTAEAVIKLLTDKNLANRLGQQGKEREKEIFNGINKWKKLGCFKFDTIKIKNPEIGIFYFFNVIKIKRLFF